MKTTTANKPEKFMPDFKASKYEMELILDIADRACSRKTVKYDIMACVMDLEACISNGCPLRLDELKHAMEGDFFHDIYGIRANINRTTGELENGFSPRYAL